MNILVTGAGGFVGKNLVENLKNAPPADGTMAVLNMIHEAEEK